MSDLNENQREELIQGSRSYDENLWKDISKSKTDAFRINDRIKTPTLKLLVKPLPVETPPGMYRRRRSPVSISPPEISRQVKTPPGISRQVKTPPEMSRRKRSLPGIYPPVKIPPVKIPPVKTYILSMIYDLDYPLIIDSLKSGRIQKYPSDMYEREAFANTPKGKKIIEILEHGFTNSLANNSCLSFLAAYMGSIPILKRLHCYHIPYDLVTPMTTYTSTYYAAKAGHMDTLKWLLDMRAKVNIFTIDAADGNGYPHIVEWLLLEKNLLRKDSLLYTQYYLEYGVGEDRLNIIKEIHTYSGKWNSAQLYPEITERTSREVVEYLWDHEAPMLSIYFKPPSNLKERSLDQIIDWWCSQKNIKNGKMFESYFRRGGKNRDLLNGKCKNEKELRKELLKRMFFSSSIRRIFICPMCKLEPK
ncbi:MAG: ankyrin repeat domain-containing protein [Cycloclasticus sp.]|nr:ankyrin repeat domain-containing protein [Cycloclasticus sp.]